MRYRFLTIVLLVIVCLTGCDTPAPENFEQAPFAATMVQPKQLIAKAGEAKVLEGRMQLLFRALCSQSLICGQHFIDRL